MAYKQLSFETSVRNPARLKSMLKVAKLYEGERLDDQTVLKIMCEMHLRSRNDEYSDLPTSGLFEVAEDDTIETIRENVIEVHEGRKPIYGFPGNRTGQGYCSRFAGYMQTPNMLGLVYVRWEEILEFSEIGNLYISDELTEQEVFAMQLIKFNVKNPFKTHSLQNDYRYFPFLLNSILQKETNRLSYTQIALSTFSIDGNVDDFLNLIERPINNYEEFSERLEEYGNFKGVEINCNEEGTAYGSSGYPDQIRRLLILSGLISERQGLYELNVRELDFIEDLLAVNFEILDSEKVPDGAYLYFKKLGSHSIQFRNIIATKRDAEVIHDEQETDYLRRIDELYNLNEQDLLYSIQSISDKRGYFVCGPSEVTIPNFLSYTLLVNKPPLMLEFLVALLIYKKYGDDYYIRPSYKTDSQGVPTGYKSKVGDIYIFSKHSCETVWLVEVTKITDRSQQLHNETTTTVRHIKDDERWIGFNNKYLNVVAPNIHDDTYRYFRVESILSALDFSTIELIEGTNKFEIQRVEEGNLLYIRPMNFNDFLNNISNSSIFEYTEEEWWKN